MNRFLKTRRQACSFILAALVSTLAPQFAVGQDNPHGLIDPAVISVGSMGDSKPNTFTSASGEFTGFDIELFRDIARRMGYSQDKILITGQDFSALMPSVANGRFDSAIAAIGVTPERQKSVGFSDGYLTFYLSVLSSNPDIKTVGDLAGKRVGLVQGTLTDIYATKNFEGADLVKFPDNNAAVSALNNGTIDAHFLDHEPAAQYTERYPALKIAIDIPSLDTPAGFVVRKDNDALREAINTALQAAIDDGTWKSLYEKWFPGAPILDRYLPKQ